MITLEFMVPFYEKSALVLNALHDEKKYLEKNMFKGPG